MSFVRIYPSQDTSIASADPSAGSQDTTLSNVGASEILNLYRTSEFSSTASILIGFPQLVPLTGAQVVLKMFDAQHAETLPSSFNVIIRPIEQAWVEGVGHDMDFYTDSGVANFASATLSTSWIPLTGTTSATFFFQTGHEDIEVDVTSLVPSAYGFIVSIDVAATGDLYVKKFHSRQTHFPTKRPYLEYRLDYGSGVLSTSTLYTVVSGDYSGTVWASSSAWAPYIASGTMITSSVFTSVVDPTGALIASIPNLKAVYDTAEVVQLKLQAQLKDWNPATTHTGSSETPSVVLTKAYLRITDVITDEVLVPFSTGSAPEYTRLGYDDHGDFISLGMASLPTGSLLQLDVIYEAPTGSGNWTLIPGYANRFRVISHG
jgi:hypothetical protein